jgi:molybdopterin/thiamine biosynthesis adenylyltransferase
MTSASEALADRDVRQRDLVPPQRLAACHALVIGVGAVGRQVALQLAAMGIAAMDLVDHDTVAVENLAPQGYRPADIGNAKVRATAAVCLAVNPDLRLGCHAEPFRRSSVRTLGCFRTGPTPEIVMFCCIDSIATRRLVWDSARHRLAFFTDGRMAAEVIRVLAAGDPPTDDHYATTLFAPERAYAGACTAKSTIYTASIAAGLMLGQFTRWLRKLPVDRDLTLNLLSTELTVT